MKTKYITIAEVNTNIDYDDTPCYVEICFTEATLMALMGISDKIKEHNENECICIESITTYTDIPGFSYKFIQADWPPSGANDTRDVWTYWDDPCGLKLRPAVSHINEEWISIVSCPKHGDKEIWFTFDFTKGLADYQTGNSFKDTKEYQERH